MLGPNSVRVDIDWAIAPYLASTLKPVVAVEIDLLGQAVQQPLDQIRSVYIDNSNSITPMYVVFPDTNFLIQCPPRSVAWQPVLTGQQKAIIFGVGFVSGLIPNTPIHFTNIDVAGYVIPVHGANLVRGLFVGAGAPPLADQTSFSADIPATTIPVSADRRIVVAVGAKAAGGGFATLVTFSNVRAVTDVAPGGVPLQPSVIVNRAGANTFGLQFFYATIPQGAQIQRITFDTGVLANNAAAGVWALYNTSDPDPLEAKFAFAGANSTNLSPLVTEDGYAMLASVYASNSAQDAVWTNAQEVAQIGNANATYSFAIIDGGADNYVPTSVAVTQAAISQSWN
jgi:hypothetical protein